MSSSSFYGRKGELAKLHALYRQIVLRDEHQPDQQTDEGKNDDVNKLVFIWGASGSGKSGLVDQFISELLQSQGGDKEDRDLTGKAADLPTLYVVRGKYNQTATSNTSAGGPGTSSKRSSANDTNPLMAISQIFQDLVRQLKCGPPEELERIQTSIAEALSPDVLPFLVSVIPALAGVLQVRELQERRESVSNASVQSCTSNSASNHMRSIDAWDADSEQMWNKLQYIFVNLVRAIATTERPLMIFLDDLQWSSRMSLDLIAKVVSDTTIRNFMLIGTIRQEVDAAYGLLPLDENLPLVEFLHRHQDTAKTAIDNIHLSNLSQSDMIPWVAQLLDRDHGQEADNSIQEFAIKLHQKTQGNVLFTLQALEELERMGILVYDTSAQQWTVCNLKPNDDLPLSDDIVKVVIVRLERLPKTMQATLSLASLLGSTFSLPILDMIMDGERSQGNNAGGTHRFCFPTKQSLPEMLEQAVLEGLLTNSIGGANYKFAHDRIQQAAMEMLHMHDTPHSGSGDGLRRRIGIQIYNMWKEFNDPGGYQPNGLQASVAAGLIDKQLMPIHIDDTLLFIGADHLNSEYTSKVGDGHNESYHMLVTTINLDVGERAAQSASFESASEYFAMAYTALYTLDSPNLWDCHYELTLRLTKARADVELASGRYELGEKLSHDVFENAKTLDDQLSMFLPFSKALGRQGRHIEACTFSRGVLRKLGEYPKGFQLMYILKSIIKMKWILRRTTNEELLNFPLKTKPRKIYAEKLLNDLGNRSFVTQDSMGLIVCILRQLDITLADGLCGQSASAFAMCSLVLDASSDRENAVRCGEIAYDILKKTRDRSRFPQVCLVVATHIYAYWEPYNQIAKRLETGRQTAMETGEFEMAFALWFCVLGHAIVCGENIDAMVSMAESIMQQARVYQVHSITSPVPWIQRLAGRVPLDWDDLLPSITQVVPPEAAGKELEYTIHFQLRAMLTILFFKHKEAEKIVRQYARATAQSDSFYLATSRVFFGGLAAAGRYRQCKKRKYIKQLSSRIGNLTKMLKEKGHMVLHQKLLLEAEAKSLRQKQPAKVREAYDVAILVADEKGFVQDAALGCELAGEHFLKTGDYNLIGDYFTRAVVFYQRWGCFAKVRDLESKRGSFLDPARMNSQSDAQRNAHEFAISVPTSSIPVQSQSAEAALFLSQSNGLVDKGVEEVDAVSVLSDKSF